MSTISQAEIVGPSGQSTLEPAECISQTLTDLGAECYTLTSPENRDEAGGPKVTMPVAILKAEADSVRLDDPVFYFKGLSASSFRRFNADAIETLRDEVSPRDLVLWDKRGLAAGQPDLLCPDLTKIDYFHNPFSEVILSDAPIEERFQILGEAFSACSDKLTGEGVDLSRYNEYEMTRDLADLVDLLGYDHINLYGHSSGEHHMISVQRYLGPMVRSVVSAGPWTLDPTPLNAAMQKY